ncbi:MAG: hypothetical protein HFF75_09375 [Oscillospiraceae bacterium]|nr:hypothetical protein [Oscillospiraceae bacterium]
MWDYAELSQKAKEAGGPEEFIESLLECGKEDGRDEMVPVVGIAFVLGLLIAAEGVKFWNNKKRKLYIKVESLKRELLSKIKIDDTQQSPREDTQWDNI